MVKYIVSWRECMNFNFKKKYGQNFLQDKTLINRIISAINLKENDLLIEIGPGVGALTSQLKDFKANYIAYEIDLDTKEYLEKYEDDKFKVIYDDFLKRDIKKDIVDIKYDKFYIIGNLPYYITTPIITKIIAEEVKPDEMVFMVQKEVADRFSAVCKTREYGSITVFLNYFYDIKRLFIVPKTKFYPVPNVDSAVIKLVKKANQPVVNMEIFNKFVKDAFRFKRKNLRNNLSGYDLDKIADILAEHGKTLNNRAEDLDYLVFVDLANKY